MRATDRRSLILGATLLAIAVASPLHAGLREQAPPPRPVPTLALAPVELLRPAPRPAPQGTAAAAVPSDPAPLAAATPSDGAPAAPVADPAPSRVIVLDPDEAAPRVAPALAGTPRPAARPEPPAGISSSGAIAPVALSLRPAPRPAGARLPAPPPSVAPPSVAPPVLATPAVASALAVAESRLPRLRPERERQAFLQRASAVRSQPPASATTGRATGNLCGVAGIEGHTIPPVVANVQGCGVANPVRVRSVDGVRLSQSAILDCDTARALHAWVKGGLRPAVGRLGGGPAELQVAAHYVCRTRNHRAGAPVSEHGRGRAIDIAAVVLADGQRMDILRHWRHATYGPVLRAAHRAACGVFTTTLGPGSDGMHEDHLHFDTRRGGRWCR